MWTGTRVPAITVFPWWTFGFTSMRSAIFGTGGGNTGIQGRSKRRQPYACGFGCSLTVNERTAPKQKGGNRTRVRPLRGDLFQQHLKGMTFGPRFARVSAPGRQSSALRSK
jgi:hypothetical protein